MSIHRADVPFFARAFVLIAIPALVESIDPAHSIAPRPLRATLTARYRAAWAPGTRIRRATGAARIR